MSSKEVEETTARTQEAIRKALEAKLHGEDDQKKTNEQPSYVKYTPASLNSKKQRMIKIVDKQEDPTLPPSFKLRKTPAGPTDDGAVVPILHEETTAKLTKAEQKKWAIPPAISNWKNTKGFTISIDKRLASVGEVEGKNEMSDRFGSLSDALEKASQDAREELKVKARLRRQKEQEQLEESQRKLRRLANEARSKGRSKGQGRWDRDEDETEEDNEEKRRRNRQRKAQRELRMASQSTGARAKELARRQGREVSERVALGVDAAAEKRKSTTTKGAATYDSNLYLKAAGTNVRRGEDQVYDRALFAQEAVNDIYRARGSDNYRGLGTKKGDNPLSGPVQFEKETKKEDTED